MYSTKEPSSKTSKTAKNTVGVQTVKGVIRLSLPRAISRAAYGMPQKFILSGLPATELNLKLMKAKAEQISIDIATGNFDITWEKYQLGVTAANKLVSIDGGKKPEMSLLELWEKYLEYVRPNLAETTFRRAFQRTYTNALTEAINNTDKTPDAIRNYIITNRTYRIHRDLLSNLEKAYQWGIQREYVTKNPYIGMSQELQSQPKKIQEDDDYNELEDIRAFNVDEMNAIIEYYESHNQLLHWANYVKFLFWTGCRPGEAAALKWRHISSD